MKAAIKQTKKRNFTWLVLLILIAVPIIIEFTAGEKLFNKSHDYILNAQEFMSEKLGLKFFANREGKNSDSQDSSDENEGGQGNISLYMNIFNSYLGEEEKLNENDTNGTTTDVFASEFIHIINTNSFYLIICGILHNFINTYKILILCMTIFSANYVSATLSYIFHSPKPYMAFYKIKSGVIFNEWSSPNDQIVLLISFLLSFYMVITRNKYAEKKICLKVILIILFTGYAFIDVFLLFAAGNVAFNHLITSVFFGVVIFIVIFFCFKINLNKPKEFYDYIRFNLLYYLTINVLLLAFNICLSYFMNYKADNLYYRDNGIIQVKLMARNSFTDIFCDYRKLFYLIAGNYCNIFCFLMNIVAFLLLKADLHFTYKNDFKSWNERMFEKSKIEKVNMDQSGQGEYSHIEDSQWNHKGKGIALIRFIFLIIMIAIIYVFFVWINSLSDNEVYSFIFLIIIPMFLHVSGIFYFYKSILTKLKLTNAPKIKAKKLVY